MSQPSGVSVPLESIASCFEGIIPSPICSCAKNGTPNLTYLSIVHRIDSNHVGLSNQFFNKTWKNIQENPRAQVIVCKPETGEQFRLDLRYEQTVTEGAIFERTRTRLDAVASQTGMTHIFRLRGVDIYEVLDCRCTAFRTTGPAAETRGTDEVQALDAFTERLSLSADLDSFLDDSLGALSELFAYDHSFLMIPDEQQHRLFTIASRGFETSGVGSEACVGEGIIGVAAQQKTIVRIASMARDVTYSPAVRSGVERNGSEDTLEREIALPGLQNVQSNLVVPLLVQDELLGVLCLQSSVAGRFRASDERLMRIVARHVAARMALLRTLERTNPVADTPATPRVLFKSHHESAVRYFRSDDSIFIDDAYLIKGVAGRILWKLLKIQSTTGRTDFSNKEIRLDSSLNLPDFKDNLESRLILLRRRLAEHCDFLILSRLRRGQIRLDVRRRLTLEELP
jgi:adenylate cyclase